MPQFAVSNFLSKIAFYVIHKSRFAIKKSMTVYTRPDSFFQKQTVHNKLILAKIGISNQRRPGRTSNRACRGSLTSGTRAATRLCPHEPCETMAVPHLRLLRLRLCGDAPAALPHPKNGAKVAATSARRSVGAPEPRQEKPISATSVLAIRLRFDHGRRGGFIRAIHWPSARQKTQNNRRCKEPCAGLDLHFTAAGHALDH